MAIGNANRTVREQSRTISVGQGIYILRYVAAGASSDRPVVHVEPGRFDRGTISVISVPGMPADLLQGPGECILLRAERPGSIEVTVRAAGPRGSLEAELQLERIAVAAASPQAAPMVPLQPAMAPREPEVEVLAHVSRRGDVVFQAGDWICGPDLPMAIEGIEIRWPNKPADVELSYQVIAGRHSTHRLPDCHVGQFAGTRGRAAPLVNIRLTLAGPGAAHYELKGDALFLGAQVVSKSGSELTFAGPTGREPLVGFRLAVVPAQPARFMPDVPNTTGGGPRHRVRVFRSARTPASVAG